MSRIFGDMRQVGIVVRDVEGAMRHWIEVCGVGPWFYVEKLPVSSFTYRDKIFPDIHISVALANSGEVQLELIQQRCNTPSMYRDFLAAGHEGMQHWSSWPEDYDARLECALSSGYRVGQAGDGPRGRFVYLWEEGHRGRVIEMAQMTPTRRNIFAAVRDAAVDWQGTDPVRRTWPSGE